MKTHAIIPIFISHLGCNNDCVFCNQRVITARKEPIKPGEIKNIIETHLSTISPNVKTVEIAFYGGSFTGLPIDEQREYLEIAKHYKDVGKIHKIHMSTRPDYINDDILSFLSSFSVDTIELGVQSFDDEILKLSKRGHTKADAYNAVSLIKEYGFELGIQLMVGLPGDTIEKAIFSAKETARLKPQLARIYPTIVLPGTELEKMLHSKDYTPLSQEKAIYFSKSIYKILHDAGIFIMRVGLKSTDLINDDNIKLSSYHPAFRQLVEGEIAMDSIKEQISSLVETKVSKVKKIILSSNPKSFSNIIGHKGVNRDILFEKYGKDKITFLSDKAISEGKYNVEIQWIK